MFRNLFSDVFNDCFVIDSLVWTYIASTLLLSPKSILSAKSCDKSINLYLFRMRFSFLNLSLISYRNGFRFWIKWGQLYHWNVPCIPPETFTNFTTLVKDIFLLNGLVVSAANLFTTNRTLKPTWKLDTLISSTW